MFQMPRNYVKKVGWRPYRNYSDCYLQEVLNLVRSKQLSIREAMKRYGIHRNVISNKLKQSPSTPQNLVSEPLDSPEVPSLGSNNILVYSSRKPGGQTALSSAEEEVICSHLIALASFGFPVTGRELRFLVQSYLNRIDREIKYFRSNLPGRDWTNLFLERHRDKLSVRMSQSVSRARAGLDQDTINNFFDNLAQELAGVPPENLWNYDESNLQDDPGSSKVIVKRGCKHPEIVKNSTKESISIMVCGNAVGTIAPVYVTYKAKNLYPTWVEGGPPYCWVII
uniref:Tigger transposable element-derived protein 6 n=1 Tax=Lygus hesperus TaxID=30085 RepID=A0A0A9VWV2_LYGHE